MVNLPNPIFIYGADEARLARIRSHLARSGAAIRIRNALRFDPFRDQESAAFVVLDGDFPQIEVAYGRSVTTLPAICKYLGLDPFEREAAPSGFEGDQIDHSAAPSAAPVESAASAPPPRYDVSRLRAGVIADAIEATGVLTDVQRGHGSRPHLLVLASQFVGGEHGDEARDIFIREAFSQAD